MEDEVATQDSGTEATHGAVMEDVSMDYGAVHADIGAMAQLGAAEDVGTGISGAGTEESVEGRRKHKPREKGNGKRHGRNARRSKARAMAEAVVDGPTGGGN